jgi:L-ascorbate metabolism protein UlaG (beta-lactamase superfamily)
LLTEEQVTAIGLVDVLMAPVGGGFTIDAAGAVEVAGQLSAKIFLPMHYKTDATPLLPLATVDDFLQSVPAGWTVEQPGDSSFTLSAVELAADGTRVIVLDHE